MVFLPEVIVSPVNFGTDKFLA